jgi:hypothetical protein
MGLGFLRAASRVKRLGGGEERFDRFVAENDERGHRPETIGKRFITARVANAANDALSAKFFQIVSGIVRIPGEVARESAMMSPTIPI